MAKRFTDTGKWKRPWFRALGLHAKVLWQYLCDECDHAGVWVADFELTSFQVGFKVDEERLANWLGDKLVKVDRDAYLIPSFLEFQYGTNDKQFSAKTSALKRLTLLGLIDESGSLKDLKDSYLRLTKESSDSIGIGIGNGKGKSKRGMQGGEPLPDFESLWAAYPRKSDRSDALRAVLANVKPDEQDLAEMAIARYRADLKAKGTEAKYIKHMATFFNKGRWRDWIDPEHGRAEDFSPAAQNDLSKIQLPDYSKAGAL